MVTVLTQGGQKIQYPDADGFHVKTWAMHSGYITPNLPQSPEPLYLFVTKAEPNVNQPSPHLPGGYQVNHEVVGQQDWDDVLAVAVGDVHRG